MPSSNLLSQVQESVARQLLLHEVVASIEYDFDLFSRVVERAPEWKDKGHPAFDPRYNTLTPENAFWTHFRDNRGETVWCEANRIHRNASFIDLVKSNRLIYDGTREVGANAYAFAYEDAFEHIKGNLCYMGSAWVHPRLRGQALPLLGMTLAYAKALQDYDCDYCIGAVRSTLVQKGVAVNTYRFAHLHFGITWRRIEPREDIELWLVYLNRIDLERELSLWVKQEPADAQVRLIA